MRWPKMDEDWRISKMTLPEGRLDMVLDTDAYNEVDDQFAICYSLLSPERLHIEAIYAAPFCNDRSVSASDGMHKSYDEIMRLLSVMDMPVGLPVLKGSDRFLPGGDEPVDSPAARDIISRAISRTDDSLLYVVAIGAITNVASALLMEPAIAGNICVVWLGGHSLSWPDTHEFNLAQDIAAARVVLSSGCPMILVPCMGVASHLLATPAELREAIGGKNAMCDVLVSLFCAYSKDHFGWAKELWDIAPIGLLNNPAWAQSQLMKSPGISDDMQWLAGKAEKVIRVVYRLNRNAIFRDMYSKFIG